MEYRARILDEGLDIDRIELERLRADPAIVFLDQRAVQSAGLREIRPAAGRKLLGESTRWVHYPWRRVVVGTLGPRAFRRMRLDRNRNKLTSEEQDRFSQLAVGVVGLSVGHAVAYTLAMEGLCGDLRLADFDELGLSNLNRIPASILDIGVNKAVVAARRIAELDPYLQVTIYPKGLTAETAESFMDGLGLVVEESDSLDCKVVVRELARERRIPVLMETSDRGLLDIERFDLEPTRPLLHGLLGDASSDNVAELTAQERILLTMRIVPDADQSPGLRASVPEMGKTLSSWPQLGSDVQLGGATIAAAVRRFGLGDELSSGRGRVDLERVLTDLHDPLEAKVVH